MERLEYPANAIIAAYERAAAAMPSRAEALHGAAKFCRLQNRFAEGYEIAARGLAISMPADALFAEPWVYETGLRDEFSINAYWAGHYRESLDACLKILETGRAAGAELQRITANARFAFEKL